MILNILNKFDDRSLKGFLASPQKTKVFRLNSTIVYVSCLTVGSYSFHGENFGRNL